MAAASVRVTHVYVSSFRVPVTPGSSSSQPLFSRSSAALQPLFSRSSAALQPLFSRSSAALQPLFSRSSAALQPLFSRSSAALPGLSGSFGPLSPLPDARLSDPAPGALSPDCPRSSARSSMPGAGMSSYLETPSPGRQQQLLDDTVPLTATIEASQNLQSHTCPSCNFNVLRRNPYDLCVRCPQCSTPKKTYYFCWQCLRQWKGPYPRSDRCDNAGCENSALLTLKACPEIKFKEVQGVEGCPSIRACPTCGKLLEHNGEKCRNIRCPDCKVQFCFVCLKDATECGKTSDCEVAPRQTSIPVKIYK